MCIDNRKLPVSRLINRPRLLCLREHPSFKAAWRLLRTNVLQEARLSHRAFCFGWPTRVDVLAGSSAEARAMAD